jgi:hypothetical protein
MSQFVTALRERITETQRKLKLAKDAEDPCAIDLRYQLRDLLDIAHRQGVDTTGWVDPEATP